MRGVRRWASPAITVAALMIVVWRLGTGPFLVGFRAVDGTAVVAGAAIVLATTLCSAWRWTVVSRGMGFRLSLPTAVASYYRALFLNLTLPSGIAGDVHRGVAHGREVDNVGGALRAVVWERTAGQVVQAVLTISVLLVLPSPVHSFTPVVAGAAVVLALLTVGVGRMRLGGSGSRLMRLRNAVVTDIRDGVLRRDAFPAVVLASAVVVLGHALTFMIAARAVGVTAPFSRVLPLALLALLGMVLPNFGGWGPREGVTAWVFAAAGLHADRGAAASVAYGVLVLAASLPGAIVLLAGWFSHWRISRLRARRSVVFRPKGATDA